MDYSSNKWRKNASAEYFRNKHRVIATKAVHMLKLCEAAILLLFSAFPSP